LKEILDHRTQSATIFSELTRSLKA